MSTIAVCSEDMGSRAVYLQGKKLPVNYMEDFSLMGFVVDRYPEALSLLRSQGFILKETEGGADIHVDSPEELREIQTSLTAKNIRCSFTDIVDTLYQA